MLFLFFLLGACDNTKRRLERVGYGPRMNNIDLRPRTPPVTVPILPTACAIAERKNLSTASLWQDGAKSFFKDQRANKVGDTVLVLVDFKDEKAKLTNNNTINYGQNTINNSMTKLMGLERNISRILPHKATPDNLINVNNPAGNHTSASGIERKETVKVKISASLIQALPNGYFVIYGHQEIRVNGEIRDLYIKGIIRPEDIDNTNTINYQNVAEARIAYGGRGDITEAQRLKWVQDFINVISPF